MGRERQWLDLDLTNAAARAAKARDVSEVARSPGQFLAQFRRAKGDPDRLAGDWRRTRNNFVNRHMAQVQANDEPLWKPDRSGLMHPSDRHLALAVWAYSPTPDRLDRYLEKQMRRNPAQIANVPEKLVREYRAKHWGLDPTAYFTIDDAALPPHLDAMGQLLELHVGREDGRGDMILTFPIRQTENQLCWDPYCRSHRMYPVIDRSQQDRMRRRLWRNGAETYPIQEVADYVGGRQARYKQWHDPSLQVQAIGPLTHIVYRTEKQGDGLSDYIHEMGEEGGHPPYLCVDSFGCLWIAGGTYDVEDRGVVK